MVDDGRILELGTWNIPDALYWRAWNRYQIKEYDPAWEDVENAIKGLSNARVYMLAGLISSFLNITFSFLNYKWFIFKTKGNYLREWSRCVAVYGGTYLLAVALLPVSVYLVRHLTTANRSAPYVAGAIQMGVISCVGFLGHRNFSFVTKKI